MILYCTGQYRTRDVDCPAWVWVTVIRERGSTSEPGDVCVQLNMHGRREVGMSR
jgi:hypothetical protein